jgi:membrane protein YqaA with SNARE-associated domain
VNGRNGRTDAAGTEQRNLAANAPDRLVAVRGRVSPSLLPVPGAVGLRAPRPGRVVAVARLRRVSHARSGPGLHPDPGHESRALGIPLFPPLPLFALTLVGIAVSSACVYWFSDSLRLGEHFEHKHRAKTERFRAALGRNPTAIVVAWSSFPLAPTDLICYVCGAMRMPLARVLIGALIGEGAICAAYIFAGNGLLSLARAWLGV